MTEYIIGIDTGATKSHLALFDTNANLIDFGRWGALTHEALSGSFAQFELELNQFVNQVLSRNGITIKQVVFAALGIAGVDTKNQHVIVSEILRRIGFEKFTLVNDAFLGIPAGSRAGVGICAINGTGCTLAGINREGRTLQIGGVGFIAGDIGGGSYMGQWVVSAVYLELFRRGVPTSMTASLFEKFHIKSKYDLIDTIHEKVRDGTFDSLSCVRILFEEAGKNDKVALGIVNEVAQSYAAGISGMIDDLKFDRKETLDIVFAGSVFVKGRYPLLLGGIEDAVNKNNPGYTVKYTLLEVPTVAGAAIWALNTLDFKSGNYDRVCSQLKNTN